MRPTTWTTGRSATQKIEELLNKLKEEYEEVTAAEPLPVR
jgi:hypothetical protein